MHLLVLIFSVRPPPTGRMLHLFPSPLHKNATLLLENYEYPRQIALPLPSMTFFSWNYAPRHAGSGSYPCFASSNNNKPQRVEEAPRFYDQSRFVTFPFFLFFPFLSQPVVFVLFLSPHDHSRYGIYTWQSSCPKKIPFPGRPFL